MTGIYRRTFFGVAAAAAMGLMATPLSALEASNYTAATYKAMQASGQPFLVDFHATWCSTCAAQERVLDKLRDANADYLAIPVIKVDWDVHSRGKLVAELQIPRRSTLVIMQGETELGRLVAQTSESVIAELLDKAI